MGRLVLASDQDQQRRFCALAGSYSLTLETPSLRQADEHWLVEAENGAVLARCSLWWRAVPELPAAAQMSESNQSRLGLIGHYAAIDNDAAQLLLEHACRQLSAQGCTLAVGPLDGNTFRHYRLLTERSIDGRAHPAFFLEPDNPDLWPTHWRQADFQPLAHYFSAIGELTAADPRLEQLAQRVGAQGVAIRPVNLAHFEEELRRIYQVVLTSFQHNFLYTPLAEAEFMAYYAKVRDYVHPALVLLAERANQPVGFLFALPDLAQAQRGQPIDTVIIKTVGVAPELGGLGLGGLLVAHCQTAAYTLGYRYAIHALMYEDNVSRKISERYARVMRRYTLFARNLSASWRTVQP